MLALQKSLHKRTGGWTKRWERVWIKVHSPTSYYWTAKKWQYALTVSINLGIINVLSLCTLSLVDLLKVVLVDDLLPLRNSGHKSTGTNEYKTCTSLDFIFFFDNWFAIKWTNTLCKKELLPIKSFRFKIKFI